MSGRAATDAVIPGRGAISVGNPVTPLPPGWRWALLTDVARLESGHTPSRKHPEYWDGPFPWIGISDARQHHTGVIHETQQSVTQAGLDNSAARLLPAGTVCLSRTASVGYTFVLGKEMATSQDFVNWVCSDALEPHFLKYAFMNEGRDGLAKFGEGTVHTTIYYPAVKAFHVALPPPAEQRRIVNRLDDLLGRARRASESLAHVPAILDQLHESVLAAAFRGDLTAEWRQAHPEVEPAVVLLERIRGERRRRFEEANPKKKYDPPAPVESDGLPELPAGWEWATLEELTDSTRLIQYGILKPGPDLPDGVPYVKVRNMKGEAIHLEGLNRTSTEIHRQYRRSALARGDLLMSIRGSYGGVALVPDELDGANITQDSARIAPLPGMSRHFLRAMLRSPACQTYFNEVAKGLAVRGVNIGDLRPTRVPLAPLAEQLEVARRVEFALAAVRAVEVEAAEMVKDIEALERATLAKAFRGELVEQDPNDEPVGELLHRLARAEEEKPERPRRGRRTTKRQTVEEASVPRELSETHLRDTLANAKRPLSPKDLLAAADLVDEIDQFYEQLRSEIERGLVRERVVDRRNRVIELILAD